MSLRRITRGHSAVHAVEWFGLALVLIWILATAAVAWRWNSEIRSVAVLQRLGAVCRQVPAPLPDLASPGPGLPPLRRSQTREVTWQPRADVPVQPAWSLFRDLPFLECVAWEASPLTPDDRQAISHLSHLQRLHLRSVRIPEGLLAQLASLPRLVELRLHDCQWTPGELSGLATAPRLEVLQLDFSPVQASDLRGLADIRTLKHLSLTGTGLVESESQILLGLRPDLELSDD
jgi:hypothetical protein